MLTAFVEEINAADLRVAEELLSKEGALVVDTAPINRFLLDNSLRLVDNPCISPDYCLDFESCADAYRRGELHSHSCASFSVPLAGFVTLFRLYRCAATGDCLWECSSEVCKKVRSVMSPCVDALSPNTVLFPATWANLVAMRKLVAMNSSESELFDSSFVFPRAAARLRYQSLGIGARLTELHWPGVAYAMKHLSHSFTANQNSIPRELVYDVNAMLAGKLPQIPFPFIGGSVPEGHQGTSVEGMSHGAVLNYLSMGMPHSGVPWGFNADHQPVGGCYDDREVALVRGCVLASYITFDISHELIALDAAARASTGGAGPTAEVLDSVLKGVLRILKERGFADSDFSSEAIRQSVSRLWPAMRKMARRNTFYKTARRMLFGKDVPFITELSIDELAGLTDRVTTAVALALCEYIGCPASFIAPAFGFQKNQAYPCNQRLAVLVASQWSVVSRFGASIGFHSGSGKSFENYRICGAITSAPPLPMHVLPDPAVEALDDATCADLVKSLGLPCGTSVVTEEPRLEIKTSGRYTYEMAVSLFESKVASDKKLFNEWYDFSVALAAAAAHSPDEAPRTYARGYIGQSVKLDYSQLSTPALVAAALSPPAFERTPHAAHFYEYCFLFHTAAGGRPHVESLGAHTREGFQQRSRFFRISPEAKLDFAKRVADYIFFLSESTGIIASDYVKLARANLKTIASLDDLVSFVAE